MTEGWATAVCVKCLHGREVCMYCKDLPTADWEAICDCGLYDFGYHLISCDIVVEPDSAETAEDS